MLHIAVTGGIACGKSLAGELLAAHGATVCDADDMAHTLLQGNNDVSRKVIEQFGPRIADSDGGIDRAALARIVFQDPAARQHLNQLVHPEIKRMCRDWLQARAREKVSLAVVIIPLLYEAGMGEGWHAVICVACSRHTQLRRLRMRGLSNEEARQRIAAQMPLRKKMKRADYVLFNEGTKALLAQQTIRVMRRIVEK